MNDQGRASPTIRQIVKPKAVMNAQNVLNKVLWTLKKDKPNYLNGTIPTELIEQFFVWTDPSTIKKYRLLSRSVYRALTTNAFLRENLNCVVPVNYKLGGDDPPMWFFWPHVYRKAFAEVYLSSVAAVDKLGILLLTPNLVTLDLPNAAIVANIDPQLGTLTNLKTLRLPNNQLFSTIPREFGKLVNLEVLDLSNNTLTGGVPRELGNLVKLKSLLLRNNKLDSTIPPHIGSLAKLRVLDLSYNPIGGVIPTTFGKLRCLKGLSLSHCKLEGSIPVGLYTLKYLSELRLDHNSFTGLISKEIRNLTSLTVLYLQQNPLLNGSISVFSTMNQLQKLKLVGTNLVGGFDRTLLADCMIELDYANETFQVKERINGEKRKLQEKIDLENREKLEQENVKQKERWSYIGEGRGNAIDLMAQPQNSTVLDGPISAILRMFYIVDPFSTNYQSVNTIPNFVAKAQPVFVLFVLIELVTIFALHISAKRESGKLLRLPTFPRLNDMIGSIGAGVFQQTFKLLIGDFELIAYMWLYEKIALVKFEAQYDLVVWILAFLGVDFGYYWAHRGAHEINLGWAGHVTHHNSQDYNLSTALRQSVTQTFFTVFFYLPLALVIPPPAFALHKMLNLLFQFWIHTEVIPPLGLLEYIINTPSSHRVHHGRNPYCIDKNYAGVLIIWDILFQTYQHELDNEKILYGITHNIHSFNPLKIQFHHSFHVLNSVLDTKSINEALCRGFMGPGWTLENPGLRLGDPNDIPQVPNLFKDPNADIGYYNPEIMGARTWWEKGFAGLNVLVAFVAVVLFQMVVQKGFGDQDGYGWEGGAVAMVTCVFGLWRIGVLLDGGRGWGIGESVWWITVWPIITQYFTGHLEADGVDAWVLGNAVNWYLPLTVMLIGWWIVVLEKPLQH
ncbi:UNVERIFIED_CONTAM: hypothetical protein HDU68_005026 [Siphonaria sp. JEL0065]|nr:hypothetical protein HDU68_005026 [Siphonaria sp. JEL0065]